MLRGTLAIALVVLTASACSVSKQVSTKSDVRSQTTEQRDSVRVEQVMVAVHDTIVETTTITVTLREPQDKNEAPDTVRVAKVTERDCIRDRAQVEKKEVEVQLVRDTVYVERSDSTFVQKDAVGSAPSVSSGRSAFVSALRWIFGILVCVIVLLVVFKVKGLFNFFKF